MKKSNILTAIVILAILLVVLWTAIKKEDQSKLTTIAIVSIIKIDPITQLEEGFRNQVNGSSFAKNNLVKFTYDNAQNDPGLQNQIVDKIIRNKPDLVYVLGTPLAVALQRRDPNLIIVQGAVVTSPKIRTV